jgi:beta-lactam-binding protein with PASTA domain
MLDVRIKAALAAGGIVIAAAACASETPSSTTTPPSVTSTTNALPSSSTARPPQQAIVAPDLVGLTWPDAERLLRGVGWSGTIVKLPNATGAEQSPGEIVAQDPPPGTSISADSPITLQFNG